MPKSRQKEQIPCQYYHWLLGTRNEVYFADGRSNQPPLGRHSLSTRERTVAIQNLRQLDLVMAIQYGLADQKLLDVKTEKRLSLSEGRSIYEEHSRRPRISGGPREATRKRYRAVLNKFLPYLKSNRFQSWNEVNRQVLDGYASWLEEGGYAYRTEYLELTTIKQILKHFIDHELLPVSQQFDYPLQKENETNTYCWHPKEVQAILKQCDTEELRWLRNLLVGLIATGMRISELAGLMWKDVNFEQKMIHLKDESRRGNISDRNRRTTKSGKSRDFPIHPKLLAVLESMERHSDGRVFHGPLGGKVKPDTIRNIFKREVIAPLADKFPSGTDEIGFKNGRLHSFRHYFCSACANNNTPERVLMNWLGHSSSKMVKRYYHLHDEESLNQMRQITLT